MEQLPPCSQASLSLVKGIYEHYKGNRYEVLGVARHSETLEEQVVYKTLAGEQGMWVRPLPMFLETVWIDGKGEIPRFRLISANSDG